MNKRVRATVWLVSVVCLCAFAFDSWAAGAPARPEYDSPWAALDALTAAAKTGDRVALVKVLGKDAAGFMSSGDAAADSAAYAAFAAACEKRAVVVGDPVDHKRRILEIGAKGWPFPVPLAVTAQGRWYFDVKAGQKEIFSRRIGRNELSAMEVCRAYVEAQYEYYALNPDKALIAHFARFIISTPGKRDGLYWETNVGEAPSPFGVFFAAAADEGYAKKDEENRHAYHGYRYRILTEQGKDAPHGEYGYIEKDIMFGGFALLAYPEQYGVSGVASFMISHDGVLYERDLGAKTAEQAGRIHSFNPGPGWQVVTDSSRQP